MLEPPIALQSDPNLSYESKQWISELYKYVLQNRPNLQTEIDATNGGADDLTSLNVTSIPGWAQRIIIAFAGVSISGTADILIQIGDSGGIETTGYTSSSSLLGGSTAVTNFTAGFGFRTGS